MGCGEAVYGVCCWLVDVSVWVFCGNPRNGSVVVLLGGFYAGASADA